MMFFIQWESRGRNNGAILSQRSRQSCTYLIFWSVNRHEHMLQTNSWGVPSYTLQQGL